MVPVVVIKPSAEPNPVEKGVDPYMIISSRIENLNLKAQL